MLLYIFLGLFAVGVVYELYHAVYADLEKYYFDKFKKREQKYLI